jgi:perosamine synthetase
MLINPMNKPRSRRNFLKSTAITGAGASVLRHASLAGMFTATAPNNFAAETDKPAKLGGKPVRTAAFPAWPILDDTEEKALIEVLRSKKWFRGSGQTVDRFEVDYARLMGAKHCIATSNGTSAVYASLAALEVGPGDEVIIPPYTFVATLNAVLLNHALPIFVDTDPATFQMDAKKIEAAISDRTTAIMPVHLGGNVSDLDAIMKIANSRKIPVVEDACQAHLAEWRGKKVGNYGATGCFSFQASKNLNSGEGGALLTNDDELAEKLFAFQNNCRARKTSSYNFTYRGTRGANLRLTEFQGTLLLAQMARIEQQAKSRDENGRYLAKQLGEIPGIVPAKQYDGCTRNAFHLFMFRYQAEKFAGLSRAKFLAALNAEGIPCSGGYSPLNTESFIKDCLKSRSYQRVYPAETLANWAERTRCPANDKLCEEAVWFTQTMLLGARADMDDIVAAIQKIQAHAAELAKA